MGLPVGQSFCVMGVTSAFPTNSLKPENSDSSLGHENTRGAPEIKIRSLKKKIALPLESRKSFTGTSRVGSRVVGTAFTLAASELYLALVSRC